MATFREITYMCLDLLKQISDDSYYTPDHVLFLINHYRNYVLKKQYHDIKQEIPDSNFQTVCLNVSPDNELGDTSCSNIVLKSQESLPDIMKLAEPRILLGDVSAGYITFVSPERFPNTGYNRYLKNIIYCTLLPNGKLMLKSNNPQFIYLEKIKVSAIFEYTDYAAKLSCGSTDDNCDIMDKEFPLEEALIPIVLESVVKALTGAIFQPKDYKNNAADDLSDLNNFVRNNMKQNVLSNG